MIISQIKLIFVHIPKTGGTSITKLILQKMENVEMHGNISDLPTELKAKYYLNEEKHWGLAKCKKRLEKEEAKLYKSFTVIRNPWDRVVSQYFYSKRDKTFDEFVHDIQHCRVFKSRLFQKLPAMRPQYHFVVSENKKVDKVLRFEKLEEDMKQIKILSDHALEKCNSSVHDHYTKYYNKGTRNIIGELYSKDINFFGFTFDGTATKNIWNRD